MRRREGIEERGDRGERGRRREGKEEREGKKERKKERREETVWHHASSYLMAVLDSNPLQSFQLVFR